MALFIVPLLTFLSLTSWAQTSASDTDPLIVETSILPYEWSPGLGGTLQIKMQLPPGFHAYEDQFRLVIMEPDGFKMTTPLIEPMVEWYDKFSKKNRRGIKDQAILKVHIEAPDRFLKKNDKMKLEFTYQACSDQFCLFPVTKTLDVPIRIMMAEGDDFLTNPSEQDSAPVKSLMDTQGLTQYMSQSLGLALLVAFLAGILTSFTPCIFPMIPITLAVLGNHSERRSRLQNFITSCIYVLGIATTYSLLGLAAASSGSLFGATLGNPFVLAAVCGIFLIMSLSMYGLFELQVPAFVRDRFGRSRNGSEGGLANAYLTGLFAGIVASPCVGPVLVAILTHVASTQNHVRGFLLLFSYALGLGLIFIALGLSSNLLKALPRSGPWMNSMKFVLGTLMLGAFYYYLELLLPQRWFDGALGAGLIIVASTYGAFMSAKGVGTLKHIQKGLMQAVLLVGFGYVALFAFDLRPYIQGRIMAGDSLNQIQKLDWKPYSAQALEDAAKNRKPVIIDFWAEWCAACHELEQKTFTDPRVRAMAANYVLLKFDATSESSELKALKKKYNIQGLPTVVFINKNGVWIDALTLTQFESANYFIKRMEKGTN
ncbi:Thiol:disulfide interchange protein DsbD precursor [compost metagenome]